MFALSQLLYGCTVSIWTIQRQPSDQATTGADKVSSTLPLAALPSADLHLSDDPRPMPRTRVAAHPLVSQHRTPGATAIVTPRQSTTLRCRLAAAAARPARSPAQTVLDIGGVGRLLCRSSPNAAARPEWSRPTTTRGTAPAGARRPASSWRARRSDRASRTSTSTSWTLRPDARRHVRRRRCSSGVLYHLRHPLLALEQIAAVTRGTLILETWSTWSDWADRRWRSIRSAS